ncbi:hypothetical protein DFO56_102371 [Kosakonia sp. AG348]|nr:hypothetical protein DFO56_102371 [Kosakonia sp. AG348]
MGGRTADNYFPLIFLHTEYGVQKINFSTKIPFETIFHFNEVLFSNLFNNRPSLNLN